MIRLSKSAAMGALAACALTMAAPVLAAPGAGGGMSATKSINPQESYKEGLAALDEGDFRKAEKKFSEVLMAAPDHPQANYYMGVAKVGLGKDRASVRYFEKAIEESPNFIDAREQLALVYVRLGETGKAEGQLAAMKELQAQCAGGACGDSGAVVDTAVANVEQALSGNGAAADQESTPDEEGAGGASGGGFGGLFLQRPNDGTDQYRSAVRLINQGEYSAAIADLRAAEAAAGPHPDIYNYLGFAHRKLGLMDEAHRFYAQALALDPHHLGANEYLGELYLEVGEVEKARAQLAILDGLCAFGCAEREDLARLVAIKESARSAEK